MKRFLLILALGATAFADERIREAQTQLKSQGFFYGEVNGESSAETSAAIRRFQIRNGLEITGELNDETAGALGLGGAPKRKPQVAPAPTEPPPLAEPAPAVTQPKPPVHLRRDESTDESDRAFLRREEAKRTPPPADSAIVPPPAPIPDATSDFANVFAKTPYANAPREVQEQTLRRAQTVLAERGYYRDFVDGVPGPATEQALTAFQRRMRLPVTGRLDLETLGAMRLLPGRVPIRPFYSGPREALPPVEPRGGPPRVYRGVIVD